MRLADLDTSDLRFRTSDEVFGELQAACETSPHLARFETIGHSEEGRPIAGITLGTGLKTVTLVAGAHADEPIGPETLRLLVLDGLAAQGWGAPDDGLSGLFERFTFRIVPHVNPDAEARNEPWIRGFDPNDRDATLAAYLRHRLREPPGRDVEFAYPDARPETAAATRFLFGDGAPVLHASLHGMGFAEGALLLIDRDHLAAPETEALRAGFAEAAARAGLRLHDHDRGGDKGFRYGGPGFTSTPRGEAMRDHFLALGDAETAARFGLSSMETAALASHSVLSIVTELPLFVFNAPGERTPGVPALLNQWTESAPAVAAALAAGEPIASFADAVGMRVLDLPTAVGVHLRTLDLALDAV
ncbi:MAG TPA: M14 family zinc carboxypeptidase [Rubricoccaceae bacterium]